MSGAAAEREIAGHTCRVRGLTPDTPDTIVSRAGLDAEGRSRITPHQLRYSFGSLLIDVGEATSRVSRMLPRISVIPTSAADRLRP